MNSAWAVQAATPITIEMQQLCAECLGLLGAVDPARVQACPVSCSAVLGLEPERSPPQAPGLEPHAPTTLLPQNCTCLASDI